MQSSKIDNLTLPVTEYQDEWIEVKKGSIWEELKVEKAEKVASIGQNKFVEIYKPVYADPKFNKQTIYVMLCTDQWDYRELVTLREYVQAKLIPQLETPRMLHVVYVENMFNNLDLPHAREVSGLPDRVDLIMYVHASLAEWLGRVLQVISLKHQRLCSTPDTLRKAISDWVEENS